MDPIFLIELCYKASLFVLLPVSVALFAWGVYDRKEDPGFFRLSVKLLGIAAFATGWIWLIVRYFTWHFKMEELLTKAIEQKTSVDFTDHVSPVVFELSAYWWVLALLSVMLLFLPSLKR